MKIHVAALSSAISGDALVQDGREIASSKIQAHDDIDLLVHTRFPKGFNFQGLR